MFSGYHGDARVDEAEALTSVPILVEDMRAILTSQIDKLPGEIVRDMFRAAHGTRNRHIVDFRVSFALPLLAKFYVNFALGRERRNAERLNAAGLTSSARRATLYGVIIFALLGYSLFGIFCFLYLMKSALRIDLFAGQSPFHPIYELFIS